MENIVFGITKLRIHQASVENQILIENRQLPNSFPWLEVPTILETATMFTIPAIVPKPSTSRCEKEISNESSDDSKNEDEDDASPSPSSNRRRGVCRRRMPSRASKDSLKLIRTAITKPKKRVKKEFKICQNLSDLKKIYMNKHIAKFTPTKLETIFEEDDDNCNGNGEKNNTQYDLGSQVRVVKFGNKKMRRSISFNNGLNTTKALIKKRRLKIKKTFGNKAPSIKKISLMEFHDRLTKSFDSATMADNEDEEADDDNIESSNKQQQNTSTTSPPEKYPNVADMQMDVVIAKLDTINCERNDDDDDDADDIENTSMH